MRGHDGDVASQPHGGEKSHAPAQPPLDLLRFVGPLALVPLLDPGEAQHPHVPQRIAGEDRVAVVAPLVVARVELALLDLAARQLEELDAVRVVHPQGLGQRAGGVRVGGPRHAEVHLSQQEDVRVAQRRRLPDEADAAFPVAAALHVPGHDAQGLARASGRSAVPDLHLVDLGDQPLERGDRAALGIALERGSALEADAAQPLDGLSARPRCALGSSLPRSQDDPGERAQKFTSLDSTPPVPSTSTSTCPSVPALISPLASIHSPTSSTPCPR